MEKETESKTTIKAFPGDALALALALPRVPVEAVRQSLLTSLPFLGLDQHGRRSVWGTASDVGLSMAMPWPGPRGFSWPSHPQAVAPEAPAATPLPTKPFHTNQGSTVGFPTIGLMISGTSKRQAGTGGAPPNGGRLSTQKLSPALFGILSQNGGRFATKITTQKRVPNDSGASVGSSSIASQEHIPFGILSTHATRPFSVATSAMHREGNATLSSAMMMSRLEPTQAALGSIENRPSSSQPANNAEWGPVHTDPGTVAISQSENISTMKGSIVNRIVGPLASKSSERFSVPTTPSDRRHGPTGIPRRKLATTPFSESVGSEYDGLTSAPTGPMNSILRLLPALRLNSLVEPAHRPSGSTRVPADNHTLQSDGFDPPFNKAGATKARSGYNAVSAGVPRLGSSSTYSTGCASDANKQQRRVLPEPEVRMSQRNVAFRRGLTVLTDAMEVMVQRQVKAAVERKVDATMSQVPNADPSSGGIKAGDFVSNEMARALMQKMRDLAQEERFRCGKLR